MDNLQVAKYELEPMVFQLYVSIGVFLSSMVAIPLIRPFNDDVVDTGGDKSPVFPFPPLALVAGALFVVSVSLSFAAIRYVGIALAQGVWCGTAIVVSYLWGIIAFQDRIDSPLLAAAALLLLLFGVSSIAFCGPLGEYLEEKGFCEQRDRSDPYMLMLGENGAASGGEAKDQEDPELPGQASMSSKSRAASRRLTGILLSMGVGLAGGSVLVPLHYIPKKLAGLAFLPAFGVGTMAASPIVAFSWFAYEGRLPAFYVRETLWAGCTSGLVWNISNVCSIIAIPAITYSIAYPILQASLVVAGLWGIYVFDEIRGTAKTVFFSAAAVTVAGVVCLALSARE